MAEVVDLTSDPDSEVEVVDLTKDEVGLDLPVYNFVDTLISSRRPLPASLEARCRHGAPRQGLLMVCDATNGAHVGYLGNRASVPLRLLLEDGIVRVRLEPHHTMLPLSRHTAMQNHIPCTVHVFSHEWFRQRVFDELELRLNTARRDSSKRFKANHTGAEMGTKRHSNGISRRLERTENRDDRQVSALDDELRFETDNGPEESVEDVLSTVSKYKVDLRPMEPSPRVTAKLHEHQKVALRWMMDRENQTWKTPDFLLRQEEDWRKVGSFRGGIIADEMGVGKSLQMIALILTNTSPEEGPTLMVCPLSVIGNWTRQAEQHTSGMSVYTFHGSDRKCSAAVLSKYELVITTFATLTSEHKSAQSPLMSVNWGRVCLDEAHKIKNSSTKGFASCKAIKARKRWVLTGTPVQNRLDDLFSLCSFLKVRGFQHRTEWQHKIAFPMKVNKSGTGVKALRGLMAIICFRRLKTSIPSLCLPKKIIDTVVMPFENRAEEKMYSSMDIKFKEVFTGFLDEGTVSHNIQYVMEMLMRLRQCCNHLSLLPEQMTAPLLDSNSPLHRLNKGGFNLLPKGLAVLCCLCDEFVDSLIQFPCGHEHCEQCKEKLLLTTRKCSMCDTYIHRSAVTSPQKQSKCEVGGFASTKVTRLVNMIRDFKRTEPNSKFVVFSQWTSMLNLVQMALMEAGFSIARLDGSMKREVREQEIKRFSTDSKVTVFLASLMAGNLGITLTAANRAFLIDPWWNPATEDQAIDRIHRFGQTAEKVEIFRFIIKGTIEERILELQAKKQTTIRAALGSGDGSADTRLTVDDIKNLLL